MKEKYLTYRNDWEAHVYEFEGKQVVELKTVEIDGQRYKVESHQDTVSYNDMGNEFSATSTQFSIRQNIHGAKIPISLNALIESKVKIKPLNFRVSERS